MYKPYVSYKSSARACDAMFRNQNLNGRPGDHHGTGQLRVVSYPPLLPLIPPSS
jgi:hypothetical protein